MRVCVRVRAWTSSEFLVQPFRLWQDEIPAHTHEDEEEVVPMQVRGQDVVAIYRQKDGEWSMYESRYAVVWPKPFVCGLTVP